jgi:NAD-dependent SIR2 family protein deacetylase
MGAVEIHGDIMICTCQLERCKHQWTARRKIDGELVKPVVCPDCHSPYWYIEKADPKKKKEVKGESKGN